MSARGGWLLLSAMLLASCDAAALCSSDVVRVVRAPRSDLYAVVEARNCGATTGYVTMVRIGRASRPQRDAREVFTADDDHGAAALGLGGTVLTDITWIDAERLRITYASHARVFRRRSAGDGITVSYQTASPSLHPGIDQPR